MTEHGLYGLPRPGRRLPNLILVNTPAYLVNRHFTATRPNQLWCTDIVRREAHRSATQSRLGAGGPKRRCTKSAGRDAAGSAIVVRRDLPRTAGPACNEAARSPCSASTVASRSPFFAATSATRLLLEGLTKQARAGKLNRSESAPTIRGQAEFLKSLIEKQACSADCVRCAQVDRSEACRHRPSSPCHRFVSRLQPELDARRPQSAWRGLTRTERRRTREAPGPHQGRRGCTSLHRSQHWRAARADREPIVARR
jgi:hypothetical protein